MEQLNIKIKKPVRDINFDALEEFLEDFDMQPQVKCCAVTIGLDSAEDTRPISLNQTLV